MTNQMTCTICGKVVNAKDLYKEFFGGESSPFICDDCYAKDHCISMFATENDTDKWVVAVDGYFGLFDTEKEADQVYEMIKSKYNWYNSAQIIEPQHKISDTWSGELPDKISLHTPIDIKDYIIRMKDRFVEKYCSTDDDSWKEIEDHFGVSLKETLVVRDALAKRINSSKE
jgi:hypothetical protein